MTRLLVLLAFGLALLIPAAASAFPRPLRAAARFVANRRPIVRIVGRIRERGGLPLVRRLRGC
jgi:hypothetical protein